MAGGCGREARVVYQKIGGINRTVFRGVAWWLCDRQALPPWGWCQECGAEVYAPGERLCRRCKEQAEWRIEN